MNIIQFLLDIPPEPPVSRAMKSGNSWLIWVAVAALAAIAGYFFWKQKRNKKNAG